MKLIEWINGITKLNKTTMDEFQTNIKDEFDSINNKISSGVPIATGYDYFGTVEPEGYMFADGREISRTEYSELFEIIGTTFGEGDGETTFNLPDKRETVSAMYKSGSTNFGTLWTKVGSETQTLTIANIPSHDHQLPYIPSSSGACKTDYSYGIANNSATNSGSGNGNAGNLGTAKTGSGSAFKIIQPTLVCNYIIKVK